MKKDLLLLLAVVAMVGITGSAMAQTSATANASATISVPISITKSADLSFGTLSGGATSGTCVIATDGTRSKTGGVTLLGSTGQNAVYSVAGLVGQGFTITLPSSAVNISDGTHTMSIDNFVARIGEETTDGTSSTIPAAGSAAVKVGATLNVAANQANGYYTGTFSVSVAYN